MCSCDKGITNKQLESLRTVCISDKNGNVEQYYECSECKKQYKEIVKQFYGHDKSIRNEKKKDFFAQHSNCKICRTQLKRKDVSKNNMPAHYILYLEVGYIEV